MLNFFLLLREKKQSYLLNSQNTCFRLLLDCIAKCLYAVLELRCLVKSFAFSHLEQASWLALQDKIHLWHHRVRNKEGREWFHKIQQNILWGIIMIQVLCSDCKGLQYKLLQKNGDHDEHKKADSSFGDGGTTEEDICFLCGKLTLIFIWRYIYIKNVCSVAAELVLVFKFHYCRNMWDIIVGFHSISWRNWEIEATCLNCSCPFLTCFPESSITDWILYFINLSYKSVISVRNLVSNIYFVHE